MHEISNPLDYKVALYIRLSKEDDSEKESESVTNQRSLLQTFTEQQRLDVFDTYIDDGFSGTTFDRPDFQRMIGDVHAGKINMIVTKDMSRLGRDYIQTGYYLEKFFPSNGVRYISLLDGVDTGIDSSINDITPFKAIINDMYAKDISRKITSVKRDKQQKGLFIGGKAPYGYMLSKEQKNTIVIDEPAAAIVKKIFLLALDGKSCREIAVTLNSEGVLSPAEYAGLATSVKGLYTGKWSSERVTFMLKNEIYIGNMVQGRTKKISYKLKQVRKMSPQDWIIVENTHEPLVSREVFDKVQLMIESRRRIRSRTHDHLLKGIIYCHECGHPLGVIRRQLASGPALYFVCRTYQRFTKDSACTCHCIRAETVTQPIVEIIRQLCLQHLDHNICATLVEQAAAEADQVCTRKREVENLSKQIGILTNQLDCAYSDKLSGTLDEVDFDRIYSHIKQERTRLSEQKKRLEAATIQSSSTIDSNVIVNQFLQSADTNRELLVSLIDRIELTENKQIIIHFRFRQPDDLT